LQAETSISGAYPRVTRHAESIAGDGQRERKLGPLIDLEATALSASQHLLDCRGHVGLAAASEMTTSGQLDSDPTVRQTPGVQFFDERDSLGPRLSKRLPTAKFAAALPGFPEFPDQPPSMVAKILCGWKHPCPAAAGVVAKSPLVRNSTLILTSNSSNEALSVTVALMSPGELDRGQLRATITGNLLRRGQGMLTTAVLSL
jgi:hypothetical protein